MKGLGHEVYFAENGQDGIEKARVERPDLILMDLVMPGMNGFQATRKLARDPETSDIPVIIVSSKSGQTDIVYGQRQGAVEYVVKPVKEAVMIDAVNRAVG